MTWSKIASTCLALLALLFMAIAQQMRAQLTIEFPKLEQAVINNFGPRNAPDVKALQTTLGTLQNKSVKDQLIGVNAFSTNTFNTQPTTLYLNKPIIGQRLLSSSVIPEGIVKITPLQNMWLCYT